MRRIRQRRRRRRLRRKSQRSVRMVQLPKQDRPLRMPEYDSRGPLPAYLGPAGLAKAAAQMELPQRGRCRPAARAAPCTSTDDSSRCAGPLQCIPDSPGSQFGTCGTPPGLTSTTAPPPPTCANGASPTGEMQASQTCSCTSTSDSSRCAGPLVCVQDSLGSQFGTCGPAPVASKTTSCSATTQPDETPASFTPASGAAAEDCANTPDAMECGETALVVDSNEPGDCGQQFGEGTVVERTEETTASFESSLGLDLKGVATVSASTSMETTVGSKYVITLTPPAGTMTYRAVGQLNRTVQVDAKRYGRYSTRDTAKVGFKIGLSGGPSAFDANGNIQAARAISLEDYISNPPAIATVADLFPTNPNFYPSLAQVVNALAVVMGTPQATAQLNSLHNNNMGSLGYVFGENWSTMPWGCRPGQATARGSRSAAVVEVCDSTVLKYTYYTWNVFYWSNLGTRYSWCPYDSGNCRYNPGQIIPAGMNYQGVAQATERKSSTIPNQPGGPRGSVRDRADLGRLPCRRRASALLKDGRQSTPGRTASWPSPAPEISPLPHRRGEHARNAPSLRVPGVVFSLGSEFSPPPRSPNTSRAAPPPVRHPPRAIASAYPPTGNHSSPAKAAGHSAKSARDPSRCGPSCRPPPRRAGAHRD